MNKIFLIKIILFHLTVQQLTARYPDHVLTTEESIFQMNRNCLKYFKNLNEIISKNKKIRIKIRSVKLNAEGFSKALQMCMTILEYYLNNKSTLRNG